MMIGGLDWYPCFTTNRNDGNAIGCMAYAFIAGDLKATRVTVCRELMCSSSKMMIGGLIWYPCITTNHSDGNAIGCMAYVFNMDDSKVTRVTIVNNQCVLSCR